MKIPVIAVLAALLPFASLRGANGNSLRDGEGTTLVSRHLDTMAYMAVMQSTAPFCAREDGYDFVDNDIGNAPGDVSKCCDLCVNKENCAAWSWSNHNGGTCWFKSGRGTVVSNANVKSGVILYPPELHPCGNLEYKTDYVGYDIGNVRMLKPQDCCAECSRFPGCHAFTHTDYNGGTCWLKSQKGRMVYNEKATSSVNYGVTIRPTCGLEYGVDYVGNDIASQRHGTPSECCAWCRQVSGCRAFSWTNQDGGTCYLKNLKDQVVVKAGVVSAAVFPNPPAPSCAMELGVDYVGNDIGNAPSVDAYGCCSICMKKVGCNAFSWSNLNGGTCWLKSGKGATVANPNVKSSVVSSYPLPTPA